VGATGDIIQQEQTGILVPPGDVDALASALRRLLLDAELRVRLGKNARALHADMLEIGKYVERLISIWRMAASSGDARRHVKRS
jgi:glycosyltransferase involved in cell wall biosynthesis